MLFNKQTIDSISSWAAESQTKFVLLLPPLFCWMLSHLWWLVTEQSTVGIDLVIGKVVVLRWSCLLLFYENFWCFFYLLHIFTQVARCCATRFGVEVLDDLFDVLCVILIEVILKLVFSISFLFLVVNLDMFQEKCFFLLLILYVPINEKKQKSLHLFYRKKENRRWNVGSAQ